MSGALVGSMVALCNVVFLAGAIDIFYLRIGCGLQALFCAYALIRDAKDREPEARR